MGMGIDRTADTAMNHSSTALLGLRRLLGISREMRAARPVFIVGEARSGTSILYRTLMKHPSFRSHHANLVETDILAHRRRVFMFGRSYPVSLRRYMLENERAYRSFLETIRVVRIVSALALPINFVFRRPAMWLFYVNLNHLMLRAYFFYARRARGCQRLVEKTPTNTPHVAALSKTFPNGRLLYIHRHPVDVFSSYRRRGQADPHAEWARALTPDRFCRNYEESTNRVLDWVASGRRNLLMIPYEGFVGAPLEEFARLCEFLEEAFDPSAVEESDPHPGRWRGDPHLWGEIVPITKRWQDYVSVPEAEFIQARLARTMERLGYEPYGQAPARGRRQEDS